MATFQQAYAALPDHAARVAFLIRHVTAYEQRVATALSLLLAGERVTITGAIETERYSDGFDIGYERNVTVRVGTFEFHEVYYADLAAAWDDPVAVRAAVFARDVARLRGAGQPAADAADGDGEGDGHVHVGDSDDGNEEMEEAA